MVNSVSLNNERLWRANVPYQDVKGPMKLVYNTLIRSAQSWQRVTMSELDLTILRNLKKTITGKTVSEDDRISYLLAA